MENPKHEEVQQMRGLIGKLAIEIDVKNMMLLELEQKYIGASSSLRRMTKDKSRHQDRVGETQKAQLNGLHDERQIPVEIQKKELEQREKELAEREVVLFAEKEKIDALQREMDEKAEEFQCMESLNNTLIQREHKTNNELQDARKFLMKAVPELLDEKTSIGIKRMGEVSNQAFQDACTKRYPNGDWQLECVQLSSLWQSNVQDPKWHPFKHQDVDGNLQEVIDEDDGKLKELRTTWGDEVYKAVVTALLEMNEYNSSGRFIVPELWNFKDGRRASVKEVLEYSLQRLKAQPNKRKR